ncbi:ataxin-2-like [Schistocerca piceifrons]|uniref:ataxin-2-like n=1 Tax=Schistocerca piceifrons TaxID=274613 RepID=UPI001F5FCD33|nr:ataxin-2-like [Schistocerca piceifrons]
MNNKRKTRPNASRSPRTRPERSVTADGIYQNPHFMHAITSHVGNNVLISTLNGSVFEGVFRTFSSQFDVVLEMAHKVNTDDPSKIDIDTVVEKLIFKPEDIVTIEVRDCDLEYATRDTFQTDTAISKFNGNISGERELEPWDEPGCNGDEFDLDSNSSLGWDPNEMFRKNERDYGVQSSFQPSMESYTVPLQKKDTKEFKDAEAKAAKIASEIESNPNYKARAELENGDEEERFAAVIRPDGQGEAGKYLPPQKRKTGPAPPSAGKGVRSTPPPQPQISQPSQQPAATQQQQQQQLPQLPSSTKAYPPLPQTNSYHHSVIFSVSQQQQQQQQQQSSQQQPQPQAHAAQPQATPQLPMPRHPSPGSPVVPVGIREPKVNGMEPKAQRTPQIRGGTRAFTNVESQGHHQGPTKQHPVAITPSSVPPAPFPSAGAGTSVPPQGQPPQQAPLATVHQAQSPLPASPSPVRSPANDGVGIVPSVTAPTTKIADQQTAPSSVSQQQQQLPQPALPTTAPNQSQGSLPRSKVPAGRGREEQLAELKKFGQDFKLAEVDSSDRKQHQNSTAPPSSVSQPLPQHQVQTPQPQQQPLVQQQQQSAPSAQQQQQQQQQQPPSSLPTQQQQPAAVQPQQQQPPQQTEEHKEQGESADKVSNALKKSTLNPNAKEFVYNPNAKPFTPRSPSTPTPSRPHTPQTPQYAAGMAMVVPTYVVTTSQPAFTNPNQGNRFRKIQVMPHRNDIASQMSVAAATGQPLLAPAPAPMHSQFTVPYAPPGHMTPQPYHQQQMVRMVAQHGGGVVPLGAVPTSVSYHHESPGPQPAPGPQLQYVPAAHAAAVGPPHPHHPHHPHHAHHHAHHHAPPPPPPPSGGGPGTPSPAQAAGNPGGPPHAHAAAAAAAAAQGAPTYHHHPGGSPAAGTPGGPAGYQQGPPPPPQGPHPPGPAPPPPPPHAFPVVCPILPTQQLGPPHAHAPHHVVQQAGAVQQAAAAVQYIHQHQGAYHHQHPAAAVGSGQPHPIQVILHTINDKESEISR